MKTLKTTFARLLPMLWGGIFFLWTSSAVTAAVVTVTNVNDAGAGSLRQAIANAGTGDIISVDASLAGQTITLASTLSIDKSLTIEGNGITISGNNTYRIMGIGNNNTKIAVVIRRTHFTNGRASGQENQGWGGAIYTYTPYYPAALTLQSCIFSNNQATSSDLDYYTNTTAHGGAICNRGNLTIQGCTFYNNSTNGSGGAIYNDSHITLTGNIFYDNAATWADMARGKVIYNDYNKGVVTSVGYNVYDNTSFSFTFDGTGDSLTSAEVSPMSFRLLGKNSAAERLLSTLPAGYPVLDFYGNLISAGGAAGAVQGVAAEGYVLDYGSSGPGTVALTAGARDVDGITTDATVTLTATPTSELPLIHWTVNGAVVETNGSASVQITMSEHKTVRAVFGYLVNTIDDYSIANDGRTTLREAIAWAGKSTSSEIAIDASLAGQTITLGSKLNISSKILTIEGKGITISGNNACQIMNITGIVVIRHVHFANGKEMYPGGAINTEANLTLQSCIFSDNYQESSSTGGGGAIFNKNILTVQGCTFYKNRAGNYGGAIYNSSGITTLTGNIFYGNISQMGLIYRQGGTVVTGGYNVYDRGMSGYQWAPSLNGPGDVYVSTPVVLLPPFRPLVGSAAAGVLSSKLPAGYPGTDFYGRPICGGGAAGAVQGTAAALHYSSTGPGTVALTVGTMETDSITTDSTVTLTATPNAGQILLRWTVNGVETNDAVEANGSSSLQIAMDGHKTVQATFGYVVNTTADNTTANDGFTTLREAIAGINSGGGNIVIAPSLAGDTITLASTLPAITRSLAIEGNGVTISGNNTCRIMSVNGASAAVEIRRVHFADGRESYYGGAIHNAGATLTLQSCIFSSNRTTSSSSGSGGAIYNSGTLAVKGCTFAYNQSYQGGAICNNTGSNLSLTGNVFYGNTASSSYGNVIYNTSGTAIATSGGYNVYDKSSYNFNFNGTRDKAGTLLPFSTETFVPVAGSDALNVLPSMLPAGYPTLDFYGVGIEGGGAAGAVQQAAVISVTLDKTSVTLEVNSTETLTATVTPANAIQGVTWSSSNTAVATVSGGIVTAVSKGTATITAASAANSTKYDEATVTVTIPTYTLTFDAQSGTVNPTSKTVAYGDTVGALPVPEYSDYVFSGWYTGQNGAGTQYTENTAYNTLNNITLYAKWTTIAGNDATLKALSVSTGLLSPAFDATTTSYRVNVANGVSSITISAIANNENATVLGTGSKNLNVGTNICSVTVTSQNGTTTKTYTVRVNRAAASASSDATLSFLSVSTGTLSPAFNSDTLRYAINVAYSTSSITIFASANHSGATVSGTGSKTLNVGTNTFDVTVIAQDGTTTKTYTLTITRAAASSDATLSFLLVSPGTLSPAFNSDTLRYAMNVAYSTSSINIYTTANHANATVSGAGYNKNLSVGENVFDVTVIAQDGTTTKTYTLTVIRAAASSDATLSFLLVSPGTLSPAFNSDTLRYAINVAYSTSSINIYTTANHANATVSGAGSKSLSVGANTFDVTVTAQNGTTTKTYTLTVIRAAAENASSDATLSALSVSTGTLSPAFNANTTAYTVNVANSVSSIAISATANHASATVSGAGSKNLSVGANTFSVTVTAQNGTTTKTYTLTVTRAAAENANSDATLKALSVSTGTLSPAFSANTTNYTVNVANSVSSITISATANHASATVSGAGSKTLNVGTNTFSITVTAQNGATKTYTVTVTRAAAENASSDATLKALSVSTGTLSPAFSANTTSYTVNVANGVSSITISATANHASATVSGAGSKILSVGTNTFSITVTAQNGTTTKTYTLTVTRAAASASSDATLKALSVSTGTLSPAFNANTTAYTVNVANSVSSITISATANHASATVSGAGSNKNLSVGENVFDVTVIAQDGTTTKTYTLTITRAAASTEVSPTLSALVVSNGVLSPTFSPAVTSYTVEVPNSVSSITLTAVSESGVTVTGAGTKPLSVGENTFNITVQSGSNLKTYTVRVTRLSLSTSVEGELQAEVSLYPNPFAGALHLTGAVGCTLTVVSTGGAAVHTQKVTSATETIRLKNLPSGIYFLRLEKDGKVKTVKAVKQ